MIWSQQAKARGCLHGIQSHQNRTNSIPSEFVLTFFSSRAPNTVASVPTMFPLWNVQISMEDGDNVGIGSARV